MTASFLETDERSVRLPMCTVHTRPMHCTSDQRGRRCAYTSYAGSFFARGRCRLDIERASRRGAERLYVAALELRVWRRYVLHSNDRAARATPLPRTSFPDADAMVARISSVARHPRIADPIAIRIATTLARTPLMASPGCQRQALSSLGLLGAGQERRASAPTICAPPV